jgi:hypothetical protein
MLEKDIENLIASYPDEFFPNEGFQLIAQQYAIDKRRVDILFEDKYGRQIIVEVKRGILSREAAGQIIEYYGLLKQADSLKSFELILCANIIPQERKLFLEGAGIDCKELGIARITEIANKYNYSFIDDSPSYAQTKLNEVVAQSASHKSEQPLQTAGNNNTSGVWIFQANPARYDILNALSDPVVGNTIHWLVARHKNKIHKGHLGLVWLSGESAGIYAVCRIETEPTIIKELPAESIYWLNSDDLTEKLRVRMTVLKRLVNKPILKRDLLKLPNTKDMFIIKAPQGTNFAVTETEWQAIAMLLP